MRKRGLSLPRINLHSKELFNNIRKRLKVTEKELPDKTIKQYLKYLNKELLMLVLQNPEGFQMTIGNQLNGVIAVSKHLPKEMRENKYETLEKIESLNIPEYLKKIYRKRYQVALDRRFNYESLYNKDAPKMILNAHSFFYAYKIMWFNHRNCKIQKTRAYVFEASVKVRKELEKMIRQGNDYYELNFNDFYRFRIKPVL